ncbi:MAG: AEC family transporter [Clostridiales bacterium]|nr:AEC family transporter [Clostridiales bacterium]
MGTIDIITALTKTFIIILPGYILQKMGFLTREHTEGMSSIITHITYPCLVITAMQMEFSMEVLNNCKYVVLIFMCVIAVAMILSKIISKIVKLPKSKSGLLAFMLVFGNTGFIGLPVLNGLFGHEAVFYGALCDASYDVFMFTVGVTLVRSAAAGAEKEKITQTLKGILNPCFFGVVIGLSLYVLKIDLPDIIGGPVQSIGAITSPLAMMVVGSHLANIKFRELFTDKYVYLVCASKLLIAPLIALTLVKLLIGTGSLLATVIVMQAAMPVAMCAVIFSEQYKADVQFSTKGVLLTTLLCIVTIPLFAILLQHI